MKNQKVIVKFSSVCERIDEQYALCRVEGYMPPESMVKLLDITDLDANPREAKLGPITDEIIESLQKEDGLFQFKSKGLLIAAGGVRPLERRRFELTFSDPAFEGILDGGHNTLAIAMHILREAIGGDHPDLKKIKRWEDIPDVWRAHRSEIAEIEDVLSFLVPVEIIYPHDGAEGQDQFESAILEIAQARNNNAELTRETKANKAGYYDAFRNAVDPGLVDDVEWKANEGGRIKVRDLVALSWIPLSVLPDWKLTSEFNITQIYTSKGFCSKAYNDLVELPGVSEDQKGKTLKVVHKGVLSAISILRDLPDLYDLIYAQFPSAYNDVSKGFGRIDDVRIFDAAQKDNVKKYLRRRPKTKFYQREVTYDYPDGFIMPLVVGLRTLMKVNEEGCIEWRVDPREFIATRLGGSNGVVSSYYSVMQMAKYDPQKVGKAKAAYNMAESAMRLQVEAMRLKPK